MRNLRDFIQILERQGELKRIATPVSADLEISAIYNQVVERGGPALLFEQVKDSDFPVLINTFGSYRRTALALEVENVNEVAERLRGLLHLPLPTGWLDKILMLPKLQQLSQFLPKWVASGPCQEETMTTPDLGRLPILRCWPLDAGRFITLPLVVTKDPETGVRNVGMYRMQVFDRLTTGMHWHRHKDGARHLEKAAQRGENLPVAVAIGADPATVYAATAPLPSGIDEFLFAGFLRQAPVELVKCRTVDLEVPAEAEFVLEGYVDPQERRTEGPFGDHTGFYSLADEYPVFHVTAITHRRDPIYMATVVGPPPQEDCYLAKATERIFLPLLQMILPEIVDINLPLEGVFHNCAVVSIHKSYPGQARKVMHALWGSGQMMFTKVIVVVEDTVNVQDLSEVAWIAFNHIDPRRDIELVQGPLDVLDHASPTPCYGAKIGIDATQKTAAEGMSRPWPPRMVMDPAVEEKARKLLAE